MSFLSSLFSIVPIPILSQKQILRKHRLIELLIGHGFCLLCFRFVESQRHTIQGDYIGTMDELADLVGVKPNLLSLAFTDPKLAFQLFWGPCTPVQYRLQGPGKWDGARKVILTTQDRIKKPLMTRIPETDNSNTSTITMAKFVLAVVFFAVVVTYL